MKQQPLVSIVTAAYNPGPRLAACLESVKGQTYPNVEHIVIDGGSTDGTLKLLQSSALKWVSEPDDGQTGALIRGFKMASGWILTWLNADDTLQPDAVEVVVKTSHRHQETEWWFGKLIVLEGKKSHTVSPPRRLTEAAFGFGNPILQPGTFFTKDAFDRVGGLDRTFNLAMDFDLWLRFFRAGCRSVFIDRVLATFEIHEMSKSGNRPWADFVLDEMKAYQKQDMVRGTAMALGRAAAHQSQRGGRVRKDALHEELQRLLESHHLPHDSASAARAAASIEAALIELQTSLVGLRHLRSPLNWRFRETRWRTRRALARAIIRG